MDYEAECKKYGPELLVALQKARAEFGQIVIVVDNDCWHTIAPGLSDLEYDEAVESGRLPRSRQFGDSGPEGLAMMLAAALGFEAERC